MNIRGNDSLGSLGRVCYSLTCAELFSTSLERWQQKACTALRLMFIKLITDAHNLSKCNPQELRITNLNKLDSYSDESVINFAKLCSFFFCSNHSNLGHTSLQTQITYIHFILQSYFLLCY